MRPKYDKELLADYLSQDALDPSAFMNYALEHFRLHYPVRQLSLLDLAAHRPYEECLNTLNTLTDAQIEKALIPVYLSHFLLPRDGAVIHIPISTATHTSTSPFDGTKRQDINCYDPVSTQLVLTLSSHFRLAPTKPNALHAYIHLRPSIEPSQLPCILQNRYGYIYCKLDHAAYTNLLNSANPKNPCSISVYRKEAIYSLPTPGSEPRLQVNIDYHVPPAVEWA